MLSILSELLNRRRIETIHNKLCVFRCKNTTKKGNIKIIARSGDEPGTSCIAVWRVTFGPLSISIVVKLFNWLNVISRNINKQSQICGPYFFNKIVVSVVFQCARITVLGSFSYYRV